MECAHEVLKKVCFAKSCSNCNLGHHLVEKHLFQSGTKQLLVMLHVLATSGSREVIEKRSGRRYKSFPDRPTRLALLAL